MIHEIKNANKSRDAVSLQLEYLRENKTNCITVAICKSRAIHEIKHDNLWRQCLFNTTPEKTTKLLLFYEQYFAFHAAKKADYRVSMNGKFNLTLIHTA